MKLMDLLNENNLNEATYSVTVDLMGPMKVQVKAKDEKEAKKLVASKLQRGMRDVKGVKKISEATEEKIIEALWATVEEALKETLFKEQ